VETGLLQIAGREEAQEAGNEAAEGNYGWVAGVGGCQEQAEEEAGRAGGERMSLMSPCYGCPHYNGLTSGVPLTKSLESENALLKIENAALKEDVASMEYLDSETTIGVQELSNQNTKLKEAIEALIAERHAIRALGTALAHYYGSRSVVSHTRLLEVSREQLKREGIARRACAAVCIRLKNNDEWTPPWLAKTEVAS